MNLSERTLELKSLPQDPKVEGGFCPKFLNKQVVFLKNPGLHESRKSSVKNPVCSIFCHFSPLKTGMFSVPKAPLYSESLG